MFRMPKYLHVTFLEWTDAIRKMTGMIENKNIIVTGAKGFIGSSLIEALSVNNTVYAIDNLLHAPNKKLLPGVKYYDASADDIFELGLGGVSFDYCFHLGEYSRVEPSFSEISLVFQNSTRQLLNVLDFCSNNKCKLIYSASSTKFSNDNIEDDLSPYAFFKSINVEIINQYSKWANLDFAICYFYNVYGPGESADRHFGTVVAKFLDIYSKGFKELPVTLPGTQRRNFTHIADTINALGLIAKYGNGDGYGIASEEAYSIVELCELLGCVPSYYPEKKGNRYSARLSTEKTLALGWCPRHSLRDYLAAEVRKCEF